MMAERRTQEQFIVRFPDGMRDRIREEAERNNRSMNAEIVARLEASFGVKIDDERIDRIVEGALAEIRKRLDQDGESTDEVPKAPG